MSYYSTEKAREIVEKLNEKSSYSAGIGARCPLCGEWGKPMHHYKRKVTADGTMMYFCCPSCGHKFKAMESH